MQIYLHCFNKMCGFSRKFYINLHKIAAKRRRKRIKFKKNLYMSEKSSNFAAAFAESDCPGLRDTKPENILI